jgi:hypothetical protein
MMNSSSKLLFHEVRSLRSAVSKINLIPSHRMNSADPALGQTRAHSSLLVPVGAERVSVPLHHYGDDNEQQQAAAY